MEVTLLVQISSREVLPELERRGKILHVSKLVNWVGLQTTSDAWKEILALPGIIRASEERTGEFLVPDA